MLLPHSQSLKHLGPGFPEIIAPLDHAEGCVESTLIQMSRLDLLLTPQMNSAQRTPMKAFATQLKCGALATSLLHEITAHLGHAEACFETTLRGMS